VIPLLLWRCPLCATNDALVHVERRFRAGRVRCRCCRAEWRVRRMPGDNFYLRLTVGQDGTRSVPSRDDDRSITAWYDVMKATLCLEPVHDPGIALAGDEVLYLASGPAELIAEESDPLFFPVYDSPNATYLDKREVRGQAVGLGRLFLTNRRLVWQGEEALCSFPLCRLNSAYAFVDFGVTLMVEMRLYTVRFLEESLLKWVTYIALVARQVGAETGHRITTSHF
jgi:hypothetical protein